MIPLHVETDYVRRPDLRIINVIHQLGAHHSRTYCFPNVKTLQRLLKQHHKITMSCRNLWRHIGALERDGYLKRICRHIKRPNGTWILHSNLYTLALRAQDMIDKTYRATKRVIHRIRARGWKSAVTESAQYEVKTLNLNHGGAQKRAPTVRAYMDALRAAVRKHE